jgi:hypothetical protein
MTEARIPWSGILTSVQPRIRLTRSFDERSHTYQEYVLRVRGRLGAEQREFLVAIGSAAHARHQFRAGVHVSGAGLHIADPRLVTAELYKVSAVRLNRRGPDATSTPRSWMGVPPALPVYRQRGHRRLDVRSYDARCTACISSGVAGCRSR